MFGFLNAPCSCFAPGQHRIYNGFFCGLCNALAREYGWLSRFLINRDSTFIAILAGAQLQEPPQPNLATCCNPLSKKRALYESGLFADYAAAVTLCGLRSKLEDDVRDEAAPRKWLAQVLSKICRDRFDKAWQTLARLEFPLDSVATQLKKQQELEKNTLYRRSGNLWTVSEPSAHALGHIFSHTAVIAGNTASEEALYESGHALGRLIYILDSYSDYEKDQLNGRFNPLFAGPFQKLTTAENRRELLRPEILNCLNRLGDAFMRVKLHRFQEVLRLILLKGVPGNAARALNLPQETVALQLPGDSSEPASKEKKRREHDAGGEGCCDLSGCLCSSSGNGDKSCADCGGCCRCCKFFGSSCHSCCDGCDSG